MRRWTVAAVVILVAVGVALLIPPRQSCPAGRTLTTTGWNEAVPRCYTEPIAELEPGTPPLEESRVGVQVVIAGAGAILALIIIAASRASTRPWNRPPQARSLTGTRSP